MSEADDLVFETTLDAPPEKVWRALTIPEYLDRWLDKPAGTEVEQVAADAPHCVTYRWREREDQAERLEESFVTFELSPQDNGRTLFRLTHRLANTLTAANTNDTGLVALMRAA